MKFGRLLRDSSEELPEIRCLFQSYKALKKQLKKLPVKGDLPDDTAAKALTQEETQFISTLSRDLSRLNEMFISKEEDFVIRLRQLQDMAADVQKTTSSDDTRRQLVYRRFVDFHGEVLLLLHWSVLAYTATVKILKKHHKRTGLLLRAPHLENLLSQPFCSTELMSQLAGKAEQSIHSLVGSLVGTLEQDPASLAPFQRRGSSSCTELTAGSEAGTSSQHAKEGPSDHAIHSHVESGQATVPNFSRESCGDTAVQEDRQQPAADAADAAATASGSVQHTTDAAAVLEPMQGPDEPSDDDDDTVDDLADLAALHSGWSAHSGLMHGLAALQGSRTIVQGSNTLRRAQLALSTWEQLRTTASTPSTVLDLSQQPGLTSSLQHQHPQTSHGQQPSDQGQQPSLKRQRLEAPASTVVVSM